MIKPIYCDGCGFITKKEAKYALRFDLFNEDFQIFPYCKECVKFQCKYQHINNFTCVLLGCIL